MGAPLPAPLRGANTMGSTPGAASGSLCSPALPLATFRRGSAAREYSHIGLATFRRSLGARENLHIALATLCPAPPRGRTCGSPWPDSGPAQPREEAPHI